MDEHGGWILSTTEKVGGGMLALFWRVCSLKENLPVHWNLLHNLSEQTAIHLFSVRAISVRHLARRTTVHYTISHPFLSLNSIVCLARRNMIYAHCNNILNRHNCAQIFFEYQNMKINKSKFPCHARIMHFTFCHIGPLQVDIPTVSVHVLEQHVHTSMYISTTNDRTML